MPTARIVQIMASGPVFGGLEKHFVDLCNGLVNSHEILAIAHPVHGQELSPEVQFCPMDLTSSRRNPINLFRLHRELRGFQPDLIHAHANKAASMVEALSRLISARRVATVHGFKSSNKVFSKFDSVIAVSNAINEKLALPQARVIANGITPGPVAERDADYIRKSLQLDNSRPIAVSVGRLRPVKGFDGLIRAWQSVDADLVIAGDGPDRDKLQSLARSLDLMDRVHLVGYRDDVPQLMSNSDLVVMSSEREGFPYVMVEALHLEKVIVSTAFPGAAELLPPSCVVPYGNPKAIGDAVNKVLANPAQAVSDYASTWKQAKAQLTVQRMVEETVAVYRRVLRAAA